MSQLITVGLFDRGHFSRGNSRRVFRFEAYHWGILVMPTEATPAADCQAFEATDVSEIDPATFRMNNPTMDWWFRPKKAIGVEGAAKLLGRVVVGQVPEDEAGHDALDAFFRAVPLPVKNTDPQQSCVTWTVDAIRNLQDAGWVPFFDIDNFKSWTLAYGDQRIQGTGPEVTRYDGT